MGLARVKVVCATSAPPSDLLPVLHPPPLPHLAAVAMLVAFGCYDTCTTSFLPICCIHSRFTLRHAPSRASAHTCITNHQHHICITFISYLTLRIRRRSGHAFHLYIAGQFIIDWSNRLSVLWAFKASMSVSYALRVLSPSRSRIPSAESSPAGSHDALQRTVDVGILY